MKKIILSLFTFCVLLIANTQNTYSQSCCNANFTSAGIKSLSWKFFPEDSTNAENYTWKWEFGDGTSSTKSSPLHTYLKAGSYIVKLTKTKQIIYNNETIKSSCAISKSVIIKAIYPPVSCIAQFSVKQTANVVVLKNESSIKGIAALHSWTFGDGNVSNTIDPIHAYLKPGTYTITLTVYVYGYKQKIESCTYTNQVTIQGKQKCNAEFTYQSTLGTFYFNEKVASNDFSYWTFGDGNFTYGSNPTHEYLNKGTYTVCQYRGKDTLNIKTNSCKTCQEVIVDSISNHNPTDSCFATFFFQRVNNTVYFNANSANNVVIERYEFGDGSFYNGSNPSHNYANAGTYTVSRLLVKNTSNGNYDDSCTSFQVVVIPNSTDTCFAGFGYSFKGDTLQLTASTTSGLHHWYFGDGNFTNGSTAQHLYNNTGSYNICHYFVNDAGDSCSTCETIVFSKPIVSPNPADGFINVSSTEDSIVSYTLMDNMGNILANKDAIYMMQTSIPVQNFPSGYYTLRVVYAYNRYAYYNVLIQH